MLKIKLDRYEHVHYSWGMLMQTSRRMDTFENTPIEPRWARHQLNLFIESFVLHAYNLYQYLNENHPKRFAACELAGAILGGAEHLNAPWVETHTPKITLDRKMRFRVIEDIRLAYKWTTEDIGDWPTD